MALSGRIRWFIQSSLLVALALTLPQASPASETPQLDPLGPIRALVKAGKYAEAEPPARAALAQARALSGEQSEPAADALDLLVEVLWRSGKFKDPETHALAERAVALREQLSGPEDLAVCASLTNLAIINRRSGDMAAAEPLLRRAVSIQEKQLGPEDPAVAKTLNSLGILLKDTARYDEARQVHERALSIREKALGPDHPDVAASLGNLGVLMLTLEDYERARDYEARSLAIMEKTLGPDHPTLTDTLSSMATALGRLGDYDGARRYRDRALAIAERTLGPEHPVVATELQNLGQLMAEMGDYEGADQLLRRALAIRGRTNGEDHFQYAEILGNLGNLLVDEGDYAAARPILEQSLTVFEKSLGPAHPETTHAADALGLLLAKMNEPAQARLQFERAIAALEAAGGAGGPSLAAYLTHLAVLDVDQGQIGQALPLAQRSLTIAEGAGPANSELADALAVLSRIRHAEGNDAEAVLLTKRALAIQEGLLGSQHPRIAPTLMELSRRQDGAGDLEGAFASALRAETISRDHVRLTARSLPERRALVYAATRVRGLDQALLELERSSPRLPERVAQAWDAVIRSRALVFDEMAARQQAGRHGEDPQIAGATEAYQASSARYANLLLAGPAGLDAVVYRRLVDAARVEREKAEQDLARQSLRFVHQQERQGYGLAEVRAAVPGGSVLVGFVTYRDAKQSRYAAFVARAAGADTVFVPLGDAGPIEGAAGHWRAEASRVQDGAGDALQRYRAAGSDLRKRAWDTLLPAIGDADRVLLVPEGALHLVSFAALPVGRDKFLIESGPRIHYLSSEKDLLAAPRNHETRGLLLALGGPDFAAGSARAANSPAAVPAAPAVRSSCSSVSMKDFPLLPGAAKEARDIAALWSAQRDAGATSPRAADPLVLTGSAATEAALRGKIAGSTIMHLATHSFFLGDQCLGTESASLRGMGGLAFDDSPAAAGARGQLEDPLRLSGLALAGANQRDPMAPSQDDGLLTSEEIASLDLSSVDWAVLSACDTGLGTVQSGEGVLGLRRAFHVAGARTLIMSLWPVDDEATARWMSALYEARLRAGLSTDEAMRAASRKVLSDLRSSHKSPHPFTWGAFVAAGDWR